jgi:hypothetical protein
MTLEELKIKALTMIEEYDENSENLTSDEDIALKLNNVINQVLNELARFKKIDGYTEMEVTEEQSITLTDIDKDIYQLNIIRGVSHDVIGNRIIFNEDGTAKIYYYKYPTQINDETDDGINLELSNEVLEIAVLGIAGLLLSNDVSSNYGMVYTNLYKEKINQLDPRNAMNSIYIDGTYNI